ncbi:DUF6665 family protein [Ferrimonas balearica]|uniref:DUF6665 family protein n=1 Tax=Ferrimonas balearica TaxID=44012 RepID=UPI001F478675|nr:DUF6665 family protein [Ferrimonas balearica]MBY6016220.1 hypothetical protein [Halomonas denitrificans]MBY6095511.1 hypothetical protein [Ferrimonas balearica]
MNRRYLSDQHQGLEWELMKEQSGALGRAGKALKAAIADYRALPDDDPGRDAALQAVCDAVWNLEMQREFVGFVDQNLDAILAEFDVPAEALARRGAQS